MRYGIDLDGVCYDFIPCFSEWLKSVTNIEYAYEDITDYYWHKCIDGLDEITFWNEFHKFGNADMYRWLPLIDGTREALEALNAHGDSLVFVTARPEYTKDTTEYVIAKDFGLNKNLYFSHGKDYKSNAIRDLGIDVFVDDGPHNAESIVDNTNAKVYLKDAPYNQKVKKHPRIIRFKTWDELLEMEGVNAIS